MSRQIFRQRALQRYNDRLERVELLRYAAPPWLLIGWLVCGLLLLAVVLLWALPAPVYVTAPGVVIADPAAERPADASVVVALIAPEAADTIQPAQPAHLSFAQADGLAQATDQPSQVLAIEPTPVSPVTVRVRYRLDRTAGQLVTGPVVVVFLPFDQPASQWQGSIGEVRIEVGSQPGLALLPGVGRFFAGPGARQGVASQ
jgi:hypothetical protein